MQTASRWILVAAASLAADVGFANDLFQGIGNHDEKAGRAARQLDSDDFLIRREARSALQAAGVAGVEALRAAAGDAGPHLAGECVSVLRRLEGDAQPDVAAAAWAALVELSGGENPAAAQLAELALAPPQPLPELHSRRFVPMRFGANRIPPQFQPGQFPVLPGQMIPAGVVGGVRRMHMQVTNGRREIELVEGPRRLLVVQDERGLQATIEDAGGGPAATRTITAADLAELRAKAPDVAAQVEPLLGGAFGRFPFGLGGRP